MYLDYGAFAPVDARVLGVMRPFLEGGVGNASSTHTLGVDARASLDGARVKVARLCGGDAEGVVFTSGATEANNLALRGVAERARGRHVVTSSIEHISVLNCARDLAKRGFQVTHVAVDGEGRIDPRAVADAVRADTAFVSIMAANGEIGAVQPVPEIGRVVRARGVPFHVDGVNALGRTARAPRTCPGSSASASRPISREPTRPRKRRASPRFAIACSRAFSSACPTRVSRDRAAPDGCRITRASSFPASRPTSCSPSSTSGASPLRPDRRATR